MRAPRINTAFYHGGEPIRILRPFLEGGEQKPYFLAMTAAGQSALNVHGLDTVVIDDMRFTSIVERGKNVLTKLHLGANEILQMAGRVHGRVAGGRVFILSDRDIDFFSLKPTEPEFQLAGDSERVAITCADLGVRADELELPVPLDRVAYRRAIAVPRGARHHREGTAHALRPRRRGDAGGARVGGAARERRRRDGAVSRRDERRRVAAPHDARGARPRGADRAGQRSPHRVQRLRRGVPRRGLHGRGVRAAAPSLPRGGDRPSGPSGAACW